MLYKIAHILRDNFPFLWDLIDIVNSWLFGLRYGDELIQANNKLNDGIESYNIKPISEISADKLAVYFAAQPNEAFTYFKPHGFDVKSLKKLQGYKAFLAYVVMDGDKIVGYFFMRSFFWGKTFIGRMVDVNYRGNGIAKMMNRKTMEIAEIIGLRVFQTISPDNISSLKSAEAENELRIIRTMPNGDLYVENLPKKN